MEIMSFFNAIGMAKKLGKSDELLGILNRLGDAEFEEAIKMLEYAQKDKNPELHINNATLLLITAHTKFYEKAKINILQETLGNLHRQLYIRTGFGNIFEFPHLQAFKKSIISLLLAACCYEILNQSNAKEGMIIKAKQVFKEYYDAVETQISLTPKLKLTLYLVEGGSRFNESLIEQKEKFHLLIESMKTS
jgi:hypothetical protein